jgi:hypothetical protein
MGGLKNLIKKVFSGKVPEEDLARVMEAAEKIDNLKFIVGKADEETLKTSAVVEIGGYDGKSLKATMSEYCEDYGVMPKEIYSMPIEAVEKYMKGIMLEYKRKGICPLIEIENRIKHKEPFIGPHSKGTNEGGSYRIYVHDELIYDDKERFFDSAFKRFQMYSEVQHIIAKNLIGKDLNEIRKQERKKRPPGTGVAGRPDKSTGRADETDAEDAS